MKLDLLLREVVIIAVSALVLALVYNFYSPNGISLIRVEPRKEVVSDSALFGSSPPATPYVGHEPDTLKHPPPGMTAPLHEQALRNPDSIARVVKAERDRKEAAAFRVISLDQFKRLRGQQRGVLIDARAQDDYRKAHIPGARNYFGDESEKYFEEIVQIPRDSLIIIYCNNPECHLGRSLAEFMSAFDFKQVVLYDDGWDGWLKAGMPVDSILAKP